MINISKSGNAIKFVFTDSDHYMYGNGEIVVPVNSLSLVIDESNMVTFRKANSNDIFLSFNPSNSNLSDKAGVIDFYKSNMVGSTGGGTESGITSGDVQTMIDNSLVDYYTDDEVDAALSGKADASDVTALENEVAAKADTSAVTAVNNALTAHTTDTGIHVNQQEKDGWNAKLDASAYTPVDLSEYWTSAQTEASIEAATSGKADTSAVTAVANDVSTVSGQVATKVATSDFNAYSAATDARIAEDEEVTAAALNNLDETKQDALTAGQGIVITNNVISSTVNITVDPTLDTGSTNPVANSAITNAINAKQDALSAGTGIEISGNVISATGGGGATYSAGYGINIDTANTISFKMPITCTTNTNDSITIGNGRNNGFWSLLVGNDMSITNSSSAIGLCANDMSEGGSSISGNNRGVLIGCANQIKGGNISIGGGIAIGDRNQSIDGGIAIGTASKASGSSTVAIGLSANATGTTKMNLNNQIKVDTNNQVYIKDKDNVNEVCIQDAIAALGGLKLVKLTQAEYDALPTKDVNTLYIISNVVA